MCVCVHIVSAHLSTESTVCVAALALRVDLRTGSGPRVGVYR